MNIFKKHLTCMALISFFTTISHTNPIEEGFNDCSHTRNHKKYQPVIEHIHGQLTEVCDAYTGRVMNDFNIFFSNDIAYRSYSSYLFLETSVKNDKESISRLYTPFGTILMLHSTDDGSLSACSSHFLDVMKND